MFIYCQESDCDLRKCVFVDLLNIFAYRQVVPGILVFHLVSIFISVSRAIYSMSPTLSILIYIIITAHNRCFMQWILLIIL